MPEYKEPLSIAAAIILPNVGGWAGGLITRTQIQPWYEGLKKPEWRPPNWAFGPVWTGIYSSIGYASYLVFKEGNGFQGAAAQPLMLYGANLALNWAWTPIFFGYHQLKWSLVEMGILDISTILCAFSFYKVNKTAGLLFVPYLAWLSIATALNYTVYRDNKAIEGSSKDKKQ